MSQKGASKAFLVILICLVGVAVLIFFPDLIPQKQDPMANRLTRTPKANMHTFQTMVETYAVDWGGIYPPDVKALYLEANQTDKTKVYPYWKDFANPVLGTSGEGNSYQDERQRKIAGIVSYLPINTSDDLAIGYSIYGYDQDGYRLQYRGKDFYLTNG